MAALGSTSSGTLIFRPNLKTNGVKIFSATMFAERDALGEKVTGWMRAHAQHKVTEITVTQSSDEAFHCISITVWFHEEGR